MSIGLLILIIIAIWLVPKLIRGYLFIHRVKKQAQTMYEQMYTGNTAYGAQQQSRRPGWSNPIKRRKKIDPEIGEYVKFQEISVTETRQSTTSETYTTEQQITDIEWEDIN